eukprot:PITA_14272
MSNQESVGSIRPRIFDGSNFFYWKIRTKTYLQSLGIDVWEIVEGGCTFPSAIPTDTTGKKQYETNARAVNTLMGSLSQSEFVKVMQLKSTKEIWNKIVLSYEGESQVKRAKLQTLRIQYETLKMHNDENIASYFLRIDEVFNSLAKGKEELNKSGHISEEEDEVKFVKKLQQGSRRFRGKLPFKCFACCRVGHYTTNYPHKGKYDKGKEYAKWNIKQSVSKKSYYTHEDSDGLSNSDEDANSNDHRLLMAYDDDNSWDALEEDDLHEEISKLKIYLEEKNMIIDTLTYQLAKKEKHNEKLECEIVGLSNDLEKTKSLNLRFAKGSETLNEIIKVQCSPLITTDLGYTEDASQSQKPSTSSKSYLDVAKNSEQSKFWQTTQKEQTPLNPKIWRRKEPQIERCGITLYVEGQANQWYIDSGWSKHMTGDKEKLHSYNALEKEKNVSFGNDSPAVIKCKGSVFLKEKVKARNVMSIDGLKQNLLSVSQSDQGNEVVFRSNRCVVRELDTGEIVIKDINIPENTICKPCQFGKQTRSHFIEKEGLASKPLEIVHTDLCGPSRKKSPHGEEYFILFIDDFSKMCWIGLLKHKYEAFEKFKAFKALVENESDRKIKFLRFDRGGEFTSDEFFEFCEQHGIKRKFSTTRTPQ